MTAKNWCFTINNWTEDDRARIDAAQEAGKFKYIVVGQEVGKKDGTAHLQGFCIMRKISRMSALAKIMPRAHLEMTRGTAKEAADYCKKDHEYAEWGDAPVEAGAAGGSAEKARWDAARLAAKEGRMEDVPSDIYIRYVGNLMKIRSLAQVTPPSLESIKGRFLWYYGPTGTGKSRKAREENPGYYVKNKNRWWDGYTGQDCVLIEEWDPEDSKYLGSYLKQWADHHCFLAEVKGGSMCIRPAKIIITSNYSMEECFVDPNVLEPLLRRFEKHHFPLSIFPSP